MRRRFRFALVGAGLAAAVPGIATAALLWTLVMTPLTTTLGQSTTFTLTATNLDPLTELGCLEVDVSGSFVIESLGTPIASNNRTWVSSRSGNAVLVHSKDGGGRLEFLDSVTFTIGAHATLAGTFLWANHAHRQQDCSLPDLAGLPLTVTVLPVLLSTSSPTPTPSPTPVATPAPTATPSPILPILPILPLPSIDLHLPTPSPTATPTPRATATPEPTTRPEPTTTPAASTGAGTSGAGPLPGGSASGGSTDAVLQIGRGPQDGGAGVEIGADLLGLLDVDVWLVPSAFVVGPGLLVILWVLLQTIGTVAWIPAVRRMAGEEDARRRPERNARA
jgi:hypothetical protein